MQLGPSYSAVLAPAGAVMYNTAMTLTFFLRYGTSVRITENVQQALANVFVNMTMLVVDMSLFYTQLNSAVVSGSSDFHARFGQSISNLESHKDFLMNEVWRIKLEQLLTSSGLSYSVDQIRRFLSPFDLTVASLSKPAASVQPRTEFTCEWFDNHLMAFVRSKDRNLLVSGRSGIGKTVLTDWIVERLQRLQGTKATDVVTFKIQPDLVSETSSTSIAKGLLLQLLDINVGSVKLLKALGTALDMASVGSPAADVEEALWRAVPEGFDYEHNATIVIDGLDHVSGGHKVAARVMERLKNVTSIRNTVRAIVLSCPITGMSSLGVREFTLEPRLVQGDVRLFVKHLIETTPQMDQLSQDERAKIVEQISVPADGSFVWAKITFATVVKHNSLSAILKSLETTARGLELALERLVFSLDLTSSDVRSLLAWLLAAQRPLHLKEIKTFLEMHPHDSQHAPRFSNIEDDVRKAIGDIVTVRDGYVRFIHTSVRSFLLNLAESVTDLSNSGKFPFMLQEAHFDVATRCMSYLKLFFARTAEPSVVPVAPEMVNDLFRDSPVLEYCVRYWSVHVERSPMFAQDGKHKLVPSFKKNFPRSVFTAALERTCWEEQVPLTKALEMHQLAFTLRTTLVGSEDPSVLQTKLTLAFLYQKLDERNKASDTLHEAYELSLKTFGSKSKITLDCATSFLSSTSATKFTTRNNASARAEKMLIFVIDTLKTAQRTTDEELIQYSTALAELYTGLGEHEKAVTLHRAVYEMSTETFGSFHSSTIETYDILLNVLRKLNKHEEVAKVQRYAYDKARKSLSVKDSRRHELATDLIEYYDSQSNTSEAEEILIDEWQSLTKAAASEDSNKFHTEKLALSVQYAQFLRKNQRTSEAQNIMLGTWSEYKDQSDFSSETMLNSFVSMAQEMKQLDMVETAQSILLTAWNETKLSTEQSSLSQVIATELVQTTQHIMQNKTEMTSSDLSIEESIMEDIAQTSTVSKNLTKNQSGQADVSFKTSESLSLFYLREERMTDAIRVCQKFLERTWPSILQEDQSGKLTLPANMQSEVVMIANRLAECHFATGETTVSERTLQNVFSASKNSLKYPDEKLTTTSATLVKFLESTHQYNKALRVYDDLYHLVKNQSGLSSEPTVQAAIRCAKYCTSHSMRKEAEPYHLDVFNSLGKDSDVLSEHAFESAKWLEDFYRKEQRWKDAKPVYTKLWQTIMTQGKQYHVTAEYFEALYKHYTTALKAKYEASDEQLRQLAVQFRETAIKFFGSESETAIHATYNLAAVSEKMEKHREEAVQLYVSIIQHAEKKKTSSALSSQLLTVVRQTKKQMAHHYSNSTTTTQQAVSIFTEEYQSSAAQHGYAHQSTLEQQRQLVKTLSKENTAESRTRVQQLLQESVTSIVNTEKDSKRLYESATHIATSYLESGNKDAAVVLSDKLRRQLVFDEHSKDLKIKLDKSDRAAFAFVAAFELTIFPDRKFSQIMSQLMTESMRYEAYHKAVQQKASLITILLRGTQLLEYLERTQRKSEYAHIRSDVLRIFKSYLGITVQDAQLQTFFTIVITHITQTEDKSTVLDAVVVKVLSELNASKFREGYELAQLENRFMVLHNELRTVDNVRQGFKLALYLSGRGTKRSGDAELSAQMLQLAGKILSTVLTASRTLNVQFATMTLDEVNMLSSLLGQLEMYSSLEPILAAVWTSRHIQQTWTSSTIVTLGRRLVEVRFAAGRVEAATHLCEDIIYNLRRVWGELDNTTLSFWCLLSELYSASGNFHAAQNVHEEVLRQTLIAVEDGDVSSDRGAAVAATHLDLLKVSYARASGWAKDSKVYTELQSQLRDEFGKEAVWTKSASAKEGVEKWSKTAPKDNFGMWVKPVSWAFVETEDAGTQHRNNLRKISGLFGASVSGVGGPRSNKTYGQELQGGKIPAVR